MFFVGFPVSVEKGLLKQYRSSDSNDYLIPINISKWHLLTPQQNSFQQLVIFIPIEISINNLIQPHWVNQNFFSTKSECLDLLWDSTSLNDPNNLEITRGRSTGLMETLLNLSGKLDKQGRLECVLSAFPIKIKYRTLCGLYFYTIEIRGLPSGTIGLLLNTR